MFGLSIGLIVVCLGLGLVKYWSRSHVRWCIKPMDMTWEDVCLRELDVKHARIDCRMCELLEG